MVDNRIRERLTGAAILVALIVLLVPELLSRPQQAGPRVVATVDEAPVRSYRMSLGDSQQSVTPLAAVASATSPTIPTAATRATPGPSEGAQAASLSADRPAGVTEAPRAVPQGRAQLAVPAPEVSRATTGANHSTAHSSAASPAKAARGGSAVHGEKGAKAARAESTPGGWAVQVGSFGSRENADRLVRSLKLKGYGAFINESSSRGREWYRVRVGPEHSRAAADAIAARLRAGGLRGAVAQAR